MKKLEREILEYLKERGWDTQRPSDIAKSISIESAELLELFQWVSMDIEETKKDTKKMSAIKSELADVFVYALEMAILLDLNVEDIVRDKLEKVKKKYPANIMKQNAGKYGSGTDPEYWKRKQSARKKSKKDFNV